MDQLTTTPTSRTSPQIVSLRRWAVVSLVANMVILHNVQWMSRKLKELQVQGYQVGEPVLKALSPYRTTHINRYGDYTLDLSRAIDPIDYKIKF